MRRRKAEEYSSGWHILPYIQMGVLFARNIRTIELQYLPLLGNFAKDSGIYRQFTAIE